MKFIAVKTLAGDLLPGDLFSTAGQDYWDTVKRNKSVGEKVYIRTNKFCPKDQRAVEVYRIIILGQ